MLHVVCGVSRDPSRVRVPQVAFGVLSRSKSFRTDFQRVLFRFRRLFKCLGFPRCPDKLVLAEPDCSRSFGSGVCFMVCCSRLLGSGRSAWQPHMSPCLCPPVPKHTLPEGSGPSDRNSQKHPKHPRAFRNPSHWRGTDIPERFDCSALRPPTSSNVAFLLFSVLFL